MTGTQNKLPINHLGAAGIQLLEQCIRGGNEAK